LLERAGLSWFNPDTFARELKAATGCDQIQANAVAWQEGLRRLDEALSQNTHYAFETTLGGRTMSSRIKAAAQSHHVLMWFCGLASPEQHIARVKARVAAGGHDIPEAKIRERYTTALKNLINLMPHLIHLQVYDNSLEVMRGSAVPDPVLVVELAEGRLLWPTDRATLQCTPEWAKPVLETALLMTD
jgi:predicted ABC-type ATPase